MGYIKGLLLERDDILKRVICMSLIEHYARDSVDSVNGEEELIEFSYRRILAARELYPLTYMETERLIEDLIMTVFPTYIKGALPEQPL